jgi:tetratricopeptide (TPR) repeat protein
LNPSIEQAEVAREHSQFKKAQSIYQKLFQKSPKDFDKAELLLGLGDVERIQGYFAEALGHYEKASRILKKLDPEAALDAEAGWALAARAIGRPQEAILKLERVLASYKKNKDQEAVAFVHWALGGTYRIAGDMRKGLRALETALRMYKKLKNDEGVSYTCCALGGIHRMMGHYSVSGKYYREANRRMRRRKDTFGIAYSYCGLGNVERMAGRFAQALPFYRKAEKLYGTIGDRVSYAYTLWSLGTTYKMLGRYPQARLAFARADRLFKETGDTRGRVYTLLGFSEVEYLISRFRKSMPPWKQAEALALKSHFEWEKLHVKTQLQLFFWKTAKDFALSYPGKGAGNKKRKAVSLVNDVSIQVSKAYRNAGSDFMPNSVPINWP